MSAESFPEYLRRVGRDYQASQDVYDSTEESPTAEDYRRAADRIEELEAMLKTVCERVEHYAPAMKRNGDLDDAHELITHNPLERP